MLPINTTRLPSLTILTSEFQWNPIDFQWEPIGFQWHPFDFQWNPIENEWNPVDFQWDPILETFPSQFLLLMTPLACNHDFP